MIESIPGGHQLLELGIDPRRIEIEQGSHQECRGSRAAPERFIADRDSEPDGCCDAAPFGVIVV